MVILEFGYPLLPYAEDLSGLNLREVSVLDNSADFDGQQCLEKFLLWMGKSEVSEYVSALSAEPF
jgi:hypothetical protein